ncbi:hypothetical protein BHE74_00055066, partial [Ensete ventricosum]
NPTPLSLSDDVFLWLPSSPLRRRWCYKPSVAALPPGGHPCGKRHCPRADTPAGMWSPLWASKRRTHKWRLRGCAPTSGHCAHRWSLRGRLPLWALPMPADGLPGGVVPVGVAPIGGYSCRRLPCRGLGYERPACWWLPPSPTGNLPTGAVFTTRICRTFLRDAISSHAVKKLIFCTSNQALIPLLGNPTGASHVQQKKENKTGFPRASSSHAKVGMRKIRKNKKL